MGGEPHQKMTGRDVTNLFYGPSTRYLTNWDTTFATTTDLLPSRPRSCLGALAEGLVNMELSDFELTTELPVRYDDEYANPPRSWSPVSFEPCTTVKVFWPDGRLSVEVNVTVNGNIYCAYSSGIWSKAAQQMAPIWRDGDVIMSFQHPHFKIMSVADDAVEGIRDWRRKRNKRRACMVLCLRKRANAELGKAEKRVMEFVGDR